MRKIHLPMRDMVGFKNVFHFGDKKWGWKRRDILGGGCAPCDVQCEKRVDLFQASTEVNVPFDAKKRADDIRRQEKGIAHMLANLWKTPWKY